MDVLHVLALIALALGARPEYRAPPEEEIRLVRERLAPIQHLSFATDLEYCGYLGHDAQGAAQFTEMQRGGHDGCTPVMPGQEITLRASLHTHGSYDPQVPAEFPTVLDMEADRDEGVDGYVSTPGGRLWHIDSRAMVTVQLCGLGCLPQDPEFHAGDDGVIAQRYTYEDLQQLESGG